MKIHPVPFSTNEIPLSLYIHIPFCLQRCGYCDFFTMPLQKDRDASFLPYLRALHQELDAMAPLFAGRTLHTLFFGGGTPSLLEPSEIAAILEHTQEIAPWEEDIEITVEVNPETWTIEKARQYQSLGVNRLSVGVQSLTAEGLAILERDHDAQSARLCYDISREAGYKRINLDLIWGRPQLTPAAWEEELQSVLTWQPDHLSLYELILEPGTPMTRAIQQGRLQLPPDEERTAMYRRTREIMEDAGMHWYEIANFCRPEQICKHNLATWQGHDYLAIGPGAHAFLSTPDYGRRRANPRNLPKYLEEPHATPWEERDARQAVLEALMGGLRIREGFSTRPLLERYQIDLDALLAKHAQPLVEAGYLLLQPTWWQLTPRGAEMLDAILHFLEQHIPAAP